ncbi:hypothetical protein [Cupriavidus sp. RAF12]|uniref:hypothetical protein n=1 Tax=Cupriavidus sp. RAF12 TaxID=3233050 RepID=UPI003F91144E
MAAGKIASLLKVILPGKTGNGKGTSQTATYNPNSNQTVLTLPTYDEHRTDIFTSRGSDDSRALMKRLFVHDPDVSAAVSAYLTLANTEPVFIVKDVNDQVDRAGQQILNQVLMFLTTRQDYSKGFQLRYSIKEISESMRYMVLLRGGVAAELITDQTVSPTEVRLADLQSIQWFEKSPGLYTPIQKALDGKDVKLDIPTFFVSFFRKDPTSIYTYSPFVSTINTIAARQQVINDLYRIMQLTGYPRMEVTILEEVLLKNAPMDVKADAMKKQTYVQDQLTSIRNAIAGIRPDQAFVHTDAVEAGVLNEKAPAMGIDITSVINTLNAQNQAGLRTMATILGRGESGVNTASVEARLFSMNAEAINQPVADIWSQLLTLAIRLQGSQSYVECKFRPIEMRSLLEMEAQMSVRASRLKEDLSLGLITDDEYHLEIYGRLRPDSAPELSGTGFMQPVAAAGADAANSDPTATGGQAKKKSATEKQAQPKGSKAANSKRVA